MAVLFVTLGIILLIIGILFSIAPPIPGPPFALGALFILHFFHPKVSFPETFLIVMSVATVVVLIIDYFVPIWGTKKFGGTKAGIRGSMAGLIGGIFILAPLPFIGPLLAIIAGPFLGAMAGELLSGKNMNVALKSGMGSFFGFLMGTGLKLGICFVMTIQFIKSLI